jgi:hypothetical protein
MCSVVEQARRWSAQSACYNPSQIFRHPLRLIRIAIVYCNLLKNYPIYIYKFIHVPVARRCDESGKGLNWRPFTDPWCCRIVESKQSGFPEESLTGSQSFTCPSDIPDAIIPRGCAAEYDAIFDHAMDEKRALIFRNTKNIQKLQ